MSCNNCNKIVDCGCNTKENCVQQDCSCPIKDFPTDCIKYTGPDLECSGIESDIILTDLIQQLDEFICEKFDFATNYFQLINVGGGAEVYKGVNLSGAKEIRSITKTGDLIVVSQNTNDINITIDEDELVNFVGGNESLYDVNNLSDGAEVYKDSVTVGNTTTFNLRSLKSDTLVITENEDDITIETNVVELQDFIVDTRFSGEVYEEKGTYAKPYKNLNNAILAYIGTGTRVDPEFEGARILCIGGQSHTFTENLSINNLILEIEDGTTIRYVGTDLYPIDFRTLQTTTGGYGNQNRNIKITLKGKGTFITEKLLAYIVHSGSLVTDSPRYSNTLIIENLQALSIYKLDEFNENITKSDLSPWISNSQPCTFYFGTVNEPMIVAEGQDVSDPIADNFLMTSLEITGSIITCISQQVIKNTSSYIRCKNTTLKHNHSSSGFTYITADDTALTGTVLTENPLLSNTLPNYKEDFCLMFLEDSARTDILNSTINTNFDITKEEAYYIINNDNCKINIQDSGTEIGRGGLNAEYFINARTFNPNIFMKNVTLNRSLNPSGKFINTTINPYLKADIKDCNIIEILPNNIDLTRGNNVSTVNIFNNRIIESLQKFNSRGSAISGGLSTGNIFINRKTITTGNFVVGEEYVIANVGDTDFTLIGATANTIGTHFTATGVGGGTTGTAYIYKRDIIL